MPILDELRPSIVVNRVTEIDFSELVHQGILYVILDLDGTIVERGSTKVPLDIVNHLIDCRIRYGISSISLVSNVGLKSLRRLSRIFQIASQLHCGFTLAYWRPFWAKPDPNRPYLKPSPEPFLQAMKDMGSTCENTVVIGDQLYTDILGGNRLGIKTIFVYPSLGKDHPITWWKRFKERRILQLLGINQPQASK